MFARRRRRRDGDSNRWRGYYFGERRGRRELDAIAESEWECAVLIDAEMMDCLLHGRRSSFVQQFRVDYC